MSVALRGSRAEGRADVDQVAVAIHDFMSTRPNQLSVALSV